MASFADDIASLYRRCGDKHIIPWIGDAFATPRPNDFRVTAVGFNCYVSERHWPSPIDRIQPWFAGWWEKTGTATRVGTHRFYNDAFRETVTLANVVAGTPGWTRLACDLDPETKRSLYATNAIKVYASEELKKSSAIHQDTLNAFIQIWRDELDTMARANALPHLVIVFGRALWESHWKSLHPGFTTAEAFRVLSYSPAGDQGAVAYHHANRVVLEVDGRHHTLILACLHHPSARVLRARRRNAQWLAARPEFRNLL